MHTEPKALALLVMLLQRCSCQQAVVCSGTEQSHCQNGYSQQTKNVDFPDFVQITMHARTLHISNASFASVSPDTAHVTTEDTKKRHAEERGGSFEDLIRNGVGNCLEPTQDPSDSSLFMAVCYSPAIQLKPGQVIVYKNSLQCGNLFCLSLGDVLVGLCTLQGTFLLQKERATSLYCDKLAGDSLSCTIALLHNSAVLV